MEIPYKLTGVLVHGFGYFMYVMEPHLPANANMNINCVYQTLRHMFDILMDPNDTRLTVWPKELYVQVDSASDNRCGAFMMFHDYLIRMGIFDQVKVSFLLVGHTHIDIDQQFVPITRQLRLSTIISIDDLVDVAWAAHSKQPEAIVKVT